LSNSPNAREISIEKSYNMNEKFEDMLTSFFEYIEEEKVDIEKLKSILQGKIRQPPIFEDDSKVTLQEFKKVDNVQVFSCILRSYCSFFNFTLLEKLMKSVKYDAGMRMMSDYKKDFEIYLQQVYVSEIPHGVGTDKEESTIFVIELSECFKSCRALYLNILKKDLSKVLQIEESCLQISIVKENSIHVVFHVYQSLESVFPLNDEAKIALKGLSYEEARIIAIGYEGMVYNISGEGKDGLKKLRSLRFLMKFFPTTYVFRNWQGK